MNYFYMQGAEAVGPVSIAKLEELYKQNLITDGMICREGSSTWIPYMHEFRKPIQNSPSYSGPRVFIVLGSLAGCALAVGLIFFGFMTLTGGAIIQAGGMALIAGGCILFVVSFLLGIIGHLIAECAQAIHQRR